MWDPVTGLYTPTKLDLFNIANEKAKLNIFWTAEDEMALAVEIHEIWDIMSKALEVPENEPDKDEDDFDLGFFSQHDLDIEVEETFIEYNIDIDDIWEFEFDYEFYFTRHDVFFYYLTLFFLIFNGYILFSVFYYLFCESMVFAFDQDETDIQNAENAFLVQDFAIRSFEIGAANVMDPFDELDSESEFVLEEDDRFITGCELFYSMEFELYMSTIFKMLRFEVPKNRMFLAEFFKVLNQFSFQNDYIKDIRIYHFCALYQLNNDKLHDSLLSMDPLEEFEFNMEFSHSIYYNDLRVNRPINICYLTL